MDILKIPDRPKIGFSRNERESHSRASEQLVEHEIARDFYNVVSLIALLAS